MLLKGNTNEGFLHLEASQYVHEGLDVNETKACTIFAVYPHRLDI